MKRKLPIFVKTLALLVLFSVGTAFANRPVQNEALGDAENATIETEKLLAEQNAIDQEAAKTLQPREPFLASILNAVGLGSANDFLVGTGNDLSSPEAVLQQASPSQTLQQTIEAQAIADYLVVTSQLAGDLAPNRMQTALSLATQGDKSILRDVSEGYRALAKALTTLTPPPALEANHGATRELLERFAGFLENLTLLAPSGIADAWKSEERATITEEASRLTQELRTTVIQYNVALPVGTIP